MYGLADCNNFFVSCERVFNPSLNGRPVVVLSNNDGCVISRSNEAKALGIGMAVPFFKIRDLVKREGVVAFSTNFSLYGDMSDRVMSVLQSMVPRMEVYSIDEAFLHLDGIRDVEAYGRHIVQTVYRSTGIPVSLGIAPSKTLGKLANHFAKKYPGYHRLCLIDTEEKRIKALQLTEVREVWGIGRRLDQMLEYHGVKTAYDLTQKSRGWVRRKMSVMGERTWMELQGKPVIGSDDLSTGKQQICTSRSFGVPITTYDDLTEAIATLASQSAVRLRKQQSAAKAIYLFVQSDRFKDDRVKSSKMITLSFYTADTAEIVTHCRQALDTIYQEGVAYKRAGVVLLDLQPQEYIQPDMFDPINRVKQRKLSKTIDEIMKKNGRDSIHIALQGEGYFDHIRQDRRSRNYTTNLDDIIDIKV